MRGLRFHMYLEGFNEGFTDISRGYNFSSIWALKLSKMSKDVLSKEETGLPSQTFSPQTSISSRSIQPFL